MLNDWGILLFGLKMRGVAASVLFLVHILQKLIITSIFLLFCTKITLITMAIILDNSVFKISYCS